MVFSSRGNTCITHVYDATARSLYNKGSGRYSLRGRRFLGGGLDRVQPSASAPKKRRPRRLRELRNIQLLGEYFKFRESLTSPYIHVYNTITTLISCHMAYLPIFFICMNNSIHRFINKFL